MRNALKFIVPLFVLITIGVYYSQSSFETNPGSWPQDNSPETVDARVTFGALDNGLRYAILPNKQPANNVSIRYLVLAGSLVEEENQLGLAHFLEHMAFNGTRHYAPEELMKELQRFGLRSGADSNAATGFDTTVYQLDMPDNSDEALNKGFEVFRDFADGLILDPAEIDKERGIILSELRDRESAGRRAYLAYQKFLFGGARFTQRWPGGDEDIIKSAPRAAFLDFYQKWYRPENSVIVVVGDIEADQVVGIIAKHFNDFTTIGEAGVKPKTPGFIPDHLRGGGFYDADLASQMVTMIQKLPDTPSPPSLELLRLSVIEDFAFSMLNNRFREKSLAGTAPYTSAGASNSGQTGYANLYGINATVQKQDWQGALSAIEQEVRRAVDFGFTTQEYKEELADYIEAFKIGMRTAETRRSPGLASQLVGTIADNQVFTHPRDDQALIMGFIGTISLEIINARFKEIWAGDPLLYTSGNLKIENVEDSLLGVWKASRDIPVEAKRQEALGTFAYTQFGNPGTVKSRQQVDDLGFTMIEFENGVKASLKVTDYNKDTFGIMVNFGNGRLSMPKNKPGLHIYSESAFPLGGLGAHTLTEIDRLFTGTSVSSGSVGFSIGDDRFWLSGGATNNDADNLLNLMTAFLTDPGYRPEAATLLARNLDRWYQQMAVSPRGAWSLDIVRQIHNGDTRFGVPSRAEFDQLTLDDMKNWISPAFKNAPLEVSVVGDFDMETMITTLGRTLGSLKRDAVAAPVPSSALKVIFPTTTKGPSLFTHKGEDNQTQINVLWPTTDSLDIRQSRTLSLAREVLTSQLDKILREQEAVTYTPSVSSNQSRVFKDYGYFNASVTTTPELADKVAGRILDIADQLANNPIETDSFKRAQQPILESLERSEKTNGYWMQRVLARAWSDPKSLINVRRLRADIETITPGEVGKVLKTFMTRAKGQIYIIHPENYKPE
jgi:zinc protease